MFHVELRQFPHVARAFNQERDELEARILKPWVEGQPIELDDRSWEPERARIAIYEGRALAPDEIGLGRGWANVTRTGVDVTQRLLTAARRAAERPPELLRLKDELLAQCGPSGLALREVVDLAAPGDDTQLASARLALAEQAVWELLHAGHVNLVRSETRLDRSEWQAVLLSWASWNEDAVSVERPPGRAS